ncbi:IF-2B-domain-containing protein [Hortaea werneckii]|nr:IF-2B-domain-containing protein [Hortaea werneckii]
MSEPVKEPQQPKPAEKQPEKPAEKPAEKPGEEQKLSPAELKKRAKAEKQARRAAEKEQRGGGAAPNGVPEEQRGQQKQQEQKPKGGSQKNQQSQQQKGGRTGGGQQQEGKHERSGSQHQLPFRRKSVSEPKETQQKKPQRDTKQVELFSHLYTQPRRQDIVGANKDVHPTIAAVGFQMSSYELCGSSARCVAMLLAFKEVIQAYALPKGRAFAMHFTPHYLSPQIDFLKSCRPISESMGNAIRYLKKIIGELDPDQQEQDVKKFLCEEIDRFIRERITVTDQAIAELASNQIKDGSVVLTYAKSSIVEKTILQAHANGKRFRVIVVDSRPLFEGKKLAISLMNAGVEVEYLPFSGIAHAVKEATLLLLGAHSMLSNGRLQSRVGTASVAMQAHKAHIPVIVCCESVKFSGKVALDSIVLNEVAPSEELLLPKPPARGPQPSPDRKDNEDEDEGQLRSLHDWKDIKGLQILNLMYDITPADYIRMVICEYGNVPPSSVPAVHRLANEGM